MVILSIVGARPQFIKATMVSKALERYHNQIREVMVHTGQHYDYQMSDVFFKELEITAPAYNLGVGSGSHGMQTAGMLVGIEQTILKEKPDVVVVYGDTNSTLAGALAAAKLRIPLAHVEAGLRSFNKFMPEEINRVLTDHISNILFAPTEMAVNNLYREGINKSSIYLVGDVMYDAAIYFGKKAENQSSVIDELGMEKNDYILATIHRAENTDNDNHLKYIFSALNAIAETISVIVPIHPRTEEALKRINNAYQDKFSKIRFIEPVGYLDMIMLEKNASVIVTDSGGVQKEAYFYQVPCIVLREETEWVELLETGLIKLQAPENQLVIEKTITDIIGLKNSYISELYGKGDTAHLITEILAT